MRRKGFAAARRTVVRRLPVVACAFAALGCSARALSLILDMPVSASAPEARQSVRRAVADSTLALLNAPGTRPPAPIESVTGRDSILALLPKDHAGNIDWTKAITADVIRPRPTLPNAPPRTEISGDQVGFDVTYSAGDSLFEAVFPHGTHAASIACASCHPRPSRTDANGDKIYRAVRATDCGGCHGRVAFDPATDCERCHTRLTKLPANRVRPTLGAELVMSRQGIDASKPLPAGQRALSIFAHGSHRIRYQCSVCHNALFPMRSGTITRMSEMADGKSCGACHNGKAAFDVGYTNCDRCHVAAAPTPRTAVASAGAPR